MEIWKENGRTLLFYYSSCSGLIHKVLSHFNVWPGSKYLKLLNSEKKETRDFITKNFHNIASFLLSHYSSFEFLFFRIHLKQKDNYKNQHIVDLVLFCLIILHNIMKFTKMFDATFRDFGIEKFLKF